MNRRSFLASSAAVAATAALEGSSSEAAPGDRREFYELRVLQFEAKAAQERYATFLKEALFPAVRRLRQPGRGRFQNPIVGKPETIFPSPCSLSFPDLAGVEDAAEARLLKIRVPQGGRPVLDLPATDPPFTHAEAL